MEKKYFYRKPTQVVFLNEKQDFIHGGIAYRYDVIDLEDGSAYSLSEIEIKEELPWIDIEEAAVGDHMDYFAPQAQGGEG